MKQLPSLTKISNYFPMHRIELVKNLLLLMSCILRSLSVNLNKCKTEAPIVLGDKDLDISNIYARFIRFFKMRDISIFCLGIACMTLDSIKGVQQTTYILMDRTNWKLGQLNRNILQIGITLSNGLMVPVFGIPLDKRGNSNESERIKLLDIVLKLCRFLGKGDIFLGDREFIGKKWISNLIKAELSFIIRLRKTDYLTDIAESLNITVEKLNRKIKRKVRANGFFFAKVKVDGKDLYYFVCKDGKKSVTSKDSYVRLLSDLSDFEQIRQGYKVRWQIEIYFAKTKKKGFNLEDLGLEKFEKVMLMAAIVGFLYTLTLMEGMKQEKIKPEKLQYYLDRPKKYKRKSIFKKGLEKIRCVIFSLLDLTRFIKQKINKKNSIELPFLKTFVGISIFEYIKSV